VGKTKAEIRADGLHISGYVNVPGRESRPVLTRHGKVIEVIEQRAFQRAIEKAGNIDLKLDHEKIIASTGENTLNVYEDAVGLRAEALVTDEETIKGARSGKLRGWSFDMTNVKDELEERAGQLPLRKVKDFVMSEITLAMRRNPFYSSTSIEIRADEEVEVEVRAEDAEISVKDITEKPNPIDYSPYENRLNSIKVGK
jgi:phage head maturation protease